MKAVFTRAAPYKDDALNLPVANVDSSVPYYEERLGFHVVSREEAPHKRAILARDSIQIGLTENGGDPSQDGCFFEVDNAEAAYEEISGGPPAESTLKVQRFYNVPYRVFFVVAPDGLCYMIGERQK